jgi:ketosteroid isomerase-like protein
MPATDNDTLARKFVEAFNTKDADQLGAFMVEDIVFRSRAWPMSSGPVRSRRRAAWTPSRR